MSVEMTLPASAQPTRRQTYSVVIGASVMLSVSMGVRQSLGLFMTPITHDLGITVSEFTFALAIQNLSWGLSQPVMGAIADRFGCRVVTVMGSLCYALGLLVTAYAGGGFGLTLGAGVLIGIALACTASNLGMAAAVRVVSPAARSTVLGVLSAVGSIGTLFCAPMAQNLIASHGWHFAMLAFFALTAVLLPAAFITGGADRVQRETAPLGPHGERPLGMAGTVRAALQHRGFVTMSIAFFVCGLQLVFLTTHLPTYLALCGQDPMLSAKALGTIGMFNVVGCYGLGWLGGRYPKHLLLGLVYVLRSVTLAVYFVTPVSPASTLVFAAIMGLLWLGVAPLVMGLITQMFGLRYVATLSGLAFFVHQIGSFIGAWGGGLVFDAFGSYDHAVQFGVLVGLTAGIAQMLAGDQPGRRRLRPAMA